MTQSAVLTIARPSTGKKGEVVKYIRIAGYKNDEINGLINRSVGRGGNTEFLYKGRSKKAVR